MFEQTITNIILQALIIIIVDTSRSLMMIRYEAMMKSKCFVFVLVSAKVNSASKQNLQVRRNTLQIP